MKNKKEVKSKEQVPYKFSALLTKNKKQLKFLGIFVLVLLVYYFITIYFRENFESYINSTAWLSAKLLSILGIKAIANNSSIITDKSVLVLSFGCEGTEPIVLFIAGVLAFPVSIKRKLPGLIAGILLLYVLNLLRILGLYIVSVYVQTSFDLFHDVLFPVLFIIFALILFVIWLKLSIKSNRHV